MLTVNGYLGTDGIAPFVDECKENDKGIFVLVKTSNPSSGEFQNLKLENGQYIYEKMGELVSSWGADTIGKYGYSDVGAVVGATHPDEAKRLREQMKHTFFLIPGYGAQGGSADMLKVCFDKNGLGGIVNNSRGIICAYKKPQYSGMTYYEAARVACLDMQEDLLKAIGKMGR
jgi:orotidine-5'-phosphate decarboxylase